MYESILEPGTYLHRPAGPNRTLTIKPTYELAAALEAIDNNPLLAHVREDMVNYIRRQQDTVLRRVLEGDGI